MPGRFFLTDPVSSLAGALGVDAGVVSNEPARANIAPGQEIIVYDGS